MQTYYQGRIQQISRKGKAAGGGEGGLVILRLPGLLDGTQRYDF